jgi:hypothetical protein
MRTFMIALLLVSPLAAQSAADFDTQLAKLTPEATKEDRVAVAKWLRANYKSSHAPKAIPALERLIQKGPEAEVRRQAAAALLMTVHQHDVECPLGLIQALRDPVDEVRWEAAVLGRPFKRKMAPGALDALIAAAKDERAEVRSTCLLLLAIAAGKDPNARVVIERAKQDKTFDVRHSAHCAWFTATDDLAEFLTYMIRVREEPDAVLNPLPEGSEEAKTQMCQRNLFVLGSAIRIIEWREERPDELAAALVKLLDHKSPAMRRGAADLVGASARKVDIKGADPANGFDAFKSPFESLLPYVDPEGKLPKEKAEPVLPSKAYPHLVERKALAKLRYASTMDTDETVRIASRRALDRFAEVPEPLAVRPREVKP